MTLAALHVLTPRALRAAVKDKDSMLAAVGLTPRHDDVVLWIAKKAAPAGLKLTDHASMRFLKAIKRVNAEVWLAEQSATMVVDAQSIYRKASSMPSAVELSDRASAALTFLASNGPSTAKEVAEAIQPGSDSRGAAQTLRRLTSDPAHVTRNEGGCYKLTRSGKNAAQRIVTSNESPSEEDATPNVDEPSVD